jgi:hypothetical protein
MTNGLTVHNTNGGRAIQLGVNESGGYTFINSGYVNSAGNSQPLAFFTGGTERVRIDSSGNLLVGKTSGPNYNTVGVDITHLGEGQFTTDNRAVLQINRQNSDGDLAVFRKDGTTVGSIGTTGGDFTVNAQSLGVLQVGGVSKYGWTGSLFYPTNNNTSDLGTSSFKFKDLYLSGIANTSRVFTDKDGDWGMEMRGSTTARIRFHTSAGGTGQVGSITVSGSSTSYNTSSDYRLKENVVNLTGASERVNQLNPSRFNFIADDTNTVVDGFLAHEVATVVPEAITGTKDAMMDEEYEVTPAVLDDDGNVTKEAVMGTRSVPDYQGIDQSKLVPLLTAALQEALAKIDAMETRLTALEG